MVDDKGDDIGYMRYGRILWRGDDNIDDERREEEMIERRGEL